nr:uncharacterized protein LOC109773188 [Aegilops tauschii subsp. strangulata]
MPTTGLPGPPGRRRLLKKTSTPHSRRPAHCPTPPDSGGVDQRPPPSRRGARAPPRDLQATLRQRHRTPDGSRRTCEPHSSWRGSCCDAGWRRAAATRCWSASPNYWTLPAEVQRLSAPRPRLRSWQKRARGPSELARPLKRWGPDNTNIDHGVARPTTTAPPSGGTSTGSPPRGRAGMPPNGHQGQAPRLVAQGAGHPGDGSSGATADAYVPRMVNLEYMPGEGPNSFPEPGWAGGTPKAGVFHESPEGFADPFSDDDGGVQPISREQAYANHGLQVNQTTTAVEDPRAVAPPPAGVVHWGLRGRGPEPGPPPRRTKQGAAWR